MIRLKKIILMLAAFLISACSSMPSIPPGQAYVSPMGGFSCRTYSHFGMNVDAAFGPHGGTVRLINEIDMTRVDVEELSPTMNVKALSDIQLFALYEGHLSHAVLPLVKQGIPGAKILWTKDTQIQGRHVLLSGILLPGKSDFTDGNGKVADGIRAEIQYTNGRYMYTVSMLDHARPELIGDAQMDIPIANVSKVFGYCDFPE